jgi:dolichol-phosphate mannosyltransferase
MITLSVVVPVKDEAENVVSLAREIAAAVRDESAEIIFVDDGSTDDTAAALAGFKPELPSLRVLQHDRNLGQSRAIRTGVLAARGEIVATLDGDGQNDPADLPALLALLLRGNDPQLAMIAGVRVNRRDASNRRFASGFANRFRRWILNDRATDSGCGLKVFRRDAFLTLPYFDHMHRFLIALMRREGYEVQEAPVNHRARRYGQSKYGNVHRAIVGLVDTFGVRWLQKRFGGPAEAKEL